MNLFQVLKRIYDSNIRNYTIYYDKHHHLLFSHMEYIGKWDAEIVKLVFPNQSIRSLTHSITQSINRSINQPINQSIIHLFIQSVSQSIILHIETLHNMT